MKNIKINPLSLIALLVCGILMVWLLGSAFGIFGNFLGWDAQQAGVVWKPLMLAFLAAAVYHSYRLITYKVEQTWQNVAAVALLIVFAVMSATGFKGTAGDIKQRITYLDLHGKVVDKDVLYNCYDGFYNFSENPVLKEYVETYGELPGRNRWNAYILNGDIPKSTAPRANEDFQWHTGAYETDRVPKDCGK